MAYGYLGRNEGVLPLILMGVRLVVVLGTEKVAQSLNPGSQKTRAAVVLLRHNQVARELGLLGPHQHMAGIILQIKEAGIASRIHRFPAGIPFGAGFAILVGYLACALVIFFNGIFVPNTVFLAEVSRQGPIAVGLTFHLVEPHKNALHLAGRHIFDQPFALQIFLPNPNEN